MGRTQSGNSAFSGTGCWVGHRVHCAILHDFARIVGPEEVHFASQLSGRFIHVKVGDSLALTAMYCQFSVQILRDIDAAADLELHVLYRAQWRAWNTSCPFQSDEDGCFTNTGCDVWTG